MAIKAMVGYFTDMQVGNFKLVPRVGYWDESDLTQFIEVVELDMFITGDTSLEDWIQTVEDYILSHAVGQSYSMTAKDIVWNAPNLISKWDAKAMKGVTSALIDGKTVGNTNIFTNNSGQDFIVTDIFFLPVTITGLGTAPIINLGKTASAYNDVATYALSFATSAGNYSKRDPKDNAVRITPGDSIVVRVATAAILTTTYTFKVVIKGIYL